jgi:hypothetical protein
MIKLSKPEIIDTGVNYTFSSANTWEYTGLSLTIPANSEVSLHFANIFANVPPTGIAITNGATNAPSTTSDNQWKLYAYSDTAPRVYVSGIMPAQTTLYVWAKASSTGSPNNIHVWGTIRTYNS